MNKATAKTPALAGLKRVSEMAKMAVVMPEAVAESVIQVAKIFVKKQVRRKLVNIEGLADSIKTNGGIHTQLWVHEEPDGSFRMIAGHRRLEAAKLLGYEKVPVKIYRGLEEKEIRRLQVSENNDREGLSLYDQAMGVLDDIENYGMDYARVIWNQDPHKTGKKIQSEAWMSKRVAITRYAQPVLDLISEGFSEDFEVLHSLNQLCELDRGEFEAMVAKARGGEVLSRESVRFKVAAVLDWIAQGEAAIKAAALAGAPDVVNSTGQGGDGAMETGGASNGGRGARDEANQRPAKPDSRRREKVAALAGVETSAERVAKDLAKARSAVISTGGDIGNVFDQMMLDLNRLRIANPKMKLNEGEWVLWQSFAAVVGPVAAKLGKKRTQQYLDRLARELKGDDASKAMTALLDELGVDEKSPGEMPAGWTF